MHRGPDLIKADPDAESACAAEVARPVAAVDAGAANPEPWKSVKPRIEREILGRCPPGSAKSRSSRGGHPDMLRPGPGGRQIFDK
jgi:hypothetical protein